MLDYIPVGAAMAAVAKRAVKNVARILMDGWCLVVDVDRIKLIMSLL
jgi:hypothetical protein